MFLFEKEVTVLVCGGRGYANKERINVALDRLNAKYPIGRIVQGGAAGADAEARRWAQERHIECVTYPANWGQHGRAAGPIRNKQMLDEENPYCVVAFDGGRGTANMISQAKARNINVWAIGPHPNLRMDLKTKDAG